jgi:hypothetical protein
MGYTHYWRTNKNIRAKAWNEATATAQRLLRESPVALEIEEVKTGVLDDRVRQDAYRRFERVFPQPALLYRDNFRDSSGRMDEKEWSAQWVMRELVLRARDKAWKEVEETLPKKRYHAIHANGTGTYKAEAFDYRDGKWVSLGMQDADASHETFAIPLRVSHLQDFDFCKTARKPYDVVVTGVLCILAEAGLDVSSDGEAEDWEAGRAWAQGVLGRPVKIPAGVDLLRHVLGEETQAAA